jgi:hypothetical protein
MIFLVEYNRSEGRLVSLKVFDDLERQKAENARLEIELGLNRAGVEHEVVLLEAASEDALRRTHRRYFEDLRQFAATIVEAPDAHIGQRHSAMALEQRQALLARGLGE